MQLALWVFPAEDFTDWGKLVGSPQVSTYVEYITLLAAVQADQERQGVQAKRVYFGVAEMLSVLTENGLENTPDNRAAVVASHESRRGL